MTLLAHAGGTGWDEIAIVAGPFLLGLTTFIAGRRAQRRHLGVE